MVERAVPFEPPHFELQLNGHSLTERGSPHSTTGYLRDTCIYISEGGLTGTLGNGEERWAQPSLPQWHCECSPIPSRLMWSHWKCKQSQGNSRKRQWQDLSHLWSHSLPGETHHTPAAPTTGPSSVLGRKPCPPTTVGDRNASRGGSRSTGQGKCVPVPHKHP